MLSISGNDPRITGHDRAVIRCRDIVVETTIENTLDPSHMLRCDALVDTGAAYLTLPNSGVIAWAR
jgi:hypothetical protein